MTAPTLTGVDALNFTENAGPTVIDSDVTFTDPDNDFDTSVLTVSGTLGGDNLSIQDVGTGTGQIGFDGTTVTFGGITIGTTTGGSNGADLLITFNASATAEAIEALIENITFDAPSYSPNTAARSITFEITDQAGQSLVDPVFVAEGGTAPFGIASSDNDEDEPTFVDIDGDGDMDLFIGTSNGAVEFFRNNGTDASGAAGSTVVFVAEGGASPFGITDEGNFAGPDFVDIDGDDDFDLFISLSNGTIVFFENTGTAMAPAFTLRTGSENPFNGDDFGDDIATGFVDIDADGDFDVFVGQGATPNNILFFENSGNFSSPIFPAAGSPTGTNTPLDGASLVEQLTPVFVDIDGDGDFDAFVGEFDGTVDFFRNTGTALNPNFVREGGESPFGITDGGFFVSPVFVDIDGDGDQDAFIGNDDGDTLFFRNTQSVADDRTANISIILVDDAPTVTGLTDRSATEDVTGALNFSGVTIADVDTTGNITVTITAADTGAVLGAVDGSGVGASVTETATGNNVVTLVGTAADITTYLSNAAAITYTSSLNRQTDDTISIQADDGVSTPNAASSATIVITAVNDAPAFTGLDGTPGFTEDSSAVALDGDVTVADLELDSLNSGNGDFSGATLTIARNGSANAVDTFSIQTGGNLTVVGSNISSGGNVIATFDTSSAGQVTVSFANNGTIPTTALANEILQAIRYSNSSNDPNANVQLNWTFSDGNSGNAQGTGDNPGTATGSVTVSITNVNDAPTLTATGGNPIFTEGGAAQDLFNTVTASTVESADRITGMTLTVTNVNDGADEILSFDGSDVALTNGNAVTTATNGLSVAVSVTGTTATVSFTGATLTSAQLQTLVDGLTYRSTSENPTTVGNRVVTITGLIDDGGTANSGADSAAPNLTSTVSLTAVNSAPTVGSVNGESSSVVAGAGAANIDLFDDATVVDSDSSDFNGGFLTISQNTGTTNGSWSVDGTTVTSGGDATVSAGETVQVNGVTVGTVDVTDDGQGGNDFTINFTTSNATSANIQVFLRNLNYSGPSGVDARTFTLTLNDNDGTTNGGDEDTTSNFTINVTPNPPVVGNLNGDSLTFTENDSATNIDVGSNATVTDADSANFNGGSVSVTFQSGQQAEDRLVIDTSGAVSLSAGQSAGSTVSVSGTAIGTIQAGSTGGSGEGLVINLTANATPALTQSLLQAIQYNNTGGENPTDGNRIIRVTVTDDESAVSANADITVNVNPVNDTPTGADSTDTVTEDVTFTFSAADFGFSDVDTGDTLQSVRIDTLPSASIGELQLSGVAVTASDVIAVADIGNLTFVPAADVNGSAAASFTFSVSDGTAFDGTPNTITIDITATNDAPVVTLPTAPTVTEDGGFVSIADDIAIADIDGSDTLSITLTSVGGIISVGPEGTGITITGDNSNTITFSGSVADVNTVLDSLAFNPNTDVSGTGAGSITIAVNDGNGGADSETLTFDVAEVNDDPTGVGLPGDVTFTEDTADDLDLSGVALADVDAGASDVTLTLTASEGTLSATAGGGVTVAGSATSTLILIGAVADIDTFLNTAANVQYTPADNDNGDDTATVTVTINDGGNTGTGGGTNIALGTVNIDITAVNDAPEGTDGSGNVTTNGTYTFAASDFGFTDVDASDSLASVRIDPLSIDNGALELNGVAVNAADVIALADIPNLIYTPSGTGEDTFTFSVEDGTDFDAAPKTFTLTVTQPAPPPPTPAPVPEPEPEPTPVVVREEDDPSGSNDTVTGGSLNDTIEGGNGNDTVDGGNGDDFLRGDEGDDNVAGGGGNDSIFAGPNDDGDDTVQGNSGDDIIGGGAGNDLIVGGEARASTREDNTGPAGDDTLFGGSGNDLIVGGSYNTETGEVVNTEGGDNRIFSGTGMDTIFGDNARDTIGGGNGDDTINGGNGDDLIFGGLGDAADNDDSIGGGGGADTLFGGSGNDTVDGGNGDDEIWGGAGDDQLSGGAGADIFVFGAISGNDVVTDFSITEDTLDLRFASIDFTSLQDVQAAASETNQNNEAGVLIDLGNNQSVFILGITLDDLTTTNVNI